MTAPAPVPDVAALCDQLEQLRAAATDGPWQYDVSEGDTVWGGDEHRPSIIALTRDPYGRCEADAVLIVALVNAAPTLIAAARERDRLRDAVTGLADSLDLEAHDEEATRAVAMWEAATRLTAVLSEALPGGEKCYACGRALDDSEEERTSGLCLRCLNGPVSS